ncbi:MAG: aminotransferase class I/II-fold pyridoxal phosphate-dependent enzyme [Nocardioides sp.]
MPRRSPWPGPPARTSVLRFPDFAVDEASLRAAFSERTRLVLLNTPHNPTGKVFTRPELELICSLAREFDAWVVTDEVYEHIVFDGLEHVPVASLPGMWDRTLTISSAGKTFSATGWKVGWVGRTAGRGGVRPGRRSSSSPMSRRDPSSRPSRRRSGSETRCMPGWRVRWNASGTCCASGLRAAGLPISHPSGTYFVVADAAALGAHDAMAFCRELPERVGVVGIPVSVFHDDPDAGRTLVRFAFCKRDEVLAEAADAVGDPRPGLTTWPCASGSWTLAAGCPQRSGHPQPWSRCHVVHRCSARSWRWLT